MLYHRNRVSFHFVLGMTIQIAGYGVDKNLAADDTQQLK